MNYLVNFKQVKDSYFKETFLPEVKLINIDNKVWQNTPVGIINVQTDTEGRLFITNENMIIDESEAENVWGIIESKTKLYKFTNTENDLIKEDLKGGIVARLPLDVDVDSLRYINNQIVLLEIEEEEERGVK